MVSSRSAALRPTRVEALDQFRGATVLAMILVNGFGGFSAVPALWKHHKTYCSAADLVMPQFFLAVGFAYRLTMTGRLAREGPRAAYAHALSRVASLLVLGLLVHGLDGGAKTWAELVALGPGPILGNAFAKRYFQTLVHVAVTSLWVLPVIARPASWRLGWMAASAALHAGLSLRGYYDWVTTGPGGIDGGVLGFLTWTIPLLTGSLAVDVLVASGPSRGAARLAALGLGLLALGYALTALDGRLDPPPFHPPELPLTPWTMSQRSGSVSYQTFAAGFSLCGFAGFLVACDLWGIRLGLFGRFGRNALAIYLVSPLAEQALMPFLPKDAPAWYVVAGAVAFVGLIDLVAAHLERHGLFLKL